MPSVKLSMTATTWLWLRVAKSRMCDLQRRSVIKISPLNGRRVTSETTSSVLKNSKATSGLVDWKAVIMAGNYTSEQSAKNCRDSSMRALGRNCIVTRGAISTN